jgi:surface protein
MSGMFSNCIYLKNIPLFNTSSVRYMESTFNNCPKVESGALALYNQVSTQAVPPINHSYTFRNCGSNTTTGATELAQIPDSWK